MTGYVGEAQVSAERTGVTWGRAWGRGSRVFELLLIVVLIAALMAVLGTALFIGGCIAVAWVTDTFGRPVRRGGPGGGARGQGPASGPRSRHRASSGMYAGSQRRDW